MEHQSVSHRAHDASFTRSSSEISRPSSATNHLNEKAGAYEHSSELESQKTTEDAGIEEEILQCMIELGRAPERFGQKISRVRLSTWWLIGALLIAIPLSIFATILRSINVSGIKVMGIIVWVAIIWTAGWSLHLLIGIFGEGWEQLCQHGLKDWEYLFLDTVTSQLAFFLALVAWGSSPIVCSVGEGICDVHWLHMLRKVLLATIPATGIFLFKDLFLEVIIIRQASRMYDLRKDVILRHFKAFSLIAGIFMKDPPERHHREAFGLIAGMFMEDISKQTHCKTVRLCFKKIISLSFIVEMRHWFTKAPVLSYNGGGGIFLRQRLLSRNDHTHAFERYLAGEGKDADFDVDNKTFVDQLWEHCTKGYRMLFADEKANIKEHIDEAFFEKGLEILHVRKMNNSSKWGGVYLTARDMMKIFDKDGDDEIRLEEWVDANVETIMALRDVNKGVRGIKGAARSVDVVLSCLMLCVTAILYAAFLTNHIGSYLTPIFTTITGLSFALSGTVTEFIAACGLVFSKQPYDVGDRVVIEDKDLIVNQICLLYTVFYRASDGAIEQISHKKICDAWITNMSRSRGLWVEESAAVMGSTDSISRPTLDEYLATLKGFIKSKPARSRYLDIENMQISLQSGKDQVKQVVVVMKLQELLVRREDILASARKQVREKLEELVRIPLVIS